MITKLVLSFITAITLLVCIPLVFAAMDDSNSITTKTMKLQTPVIPHFNSQPVDNKQTIEPYFPPEFFLANVQIVDVRVSPASPQKGETVTVAFTLKNEGYRAAYNIAVVFASGAGHTIVGVPAESTATFALRAGESKSFTQTFIPTQKGIYAYFIGGYYQSGDYVELISAATGNVQVIEKNTNATVSSATNSTTNTTIQDQTPNQAINQSNSSTIPSTISNSTTTNGNSTSNTTSNGQNNQQSNTTPQSIVSSAQAKRAIKDAQDEVDDAEDALDDAKDALKYDVDVDFDDDDIDDIKKDLREAKDLFDEAEGAYQRRDYSRAMTLALEAKAIARDIQNVLELSSRERQDLDDERNGANTQTTGPGNVNGGSQRTSTGSRTYNYDTSTSFTSSRSGPQTSNREVTPSEEYETAEGDAIEYVSTRNPVAPFPAADDKEEGVSPWYIALLIIIVIVLVLVEAYLIVRLVSDGKKEPGEIGYL